MTAHRTTAGCDEGACFACWRADDTSHADDCQCPIHNADEHTRDHRRTTQ